MSEKVKRAVVSTFVAMLMASLCYATTVVYYSNIVTTPPAVYPPYFGDVVSFNVNYSHLNGAFKFTVNEPKGDAHFGLAILANTTINTTCFTQVNVTVSNSAQTKSFNMTLDDWAGHNAVYGHTTFPNDFNKTGYIVTFNVIVGLNTTRIANQTITFWLNSWIDNGQEPPQYYSPPIE